MELLRRVRSHAKFRRVRYYVLQWTFLMYKERQEYNKANERVVISWNGWNF